MCQLLEEWIETRGRTLDQNGANESLSRIANGKCSKDAFAAERKTGSQSCAVERGAELLAPWSSGASETGKFAWYTAYARDSIMRSRRLALKLIACHEADQD
jgi:hypothetical protein